jgi:DNA polymerase-3 subunit delta'
LAALFEKTTAPHALLFTGIEGVGKAFTAYRYAMAWNCLNGGMESQPNPKTQPVKSCEDGRLPRDFFRIPCGTCQACRKIQSNTHPDIITIGPLGAAIKIDQIRELHEILALKPYEAQTRVVMIKEAHRMNTAAGNALLKLLEEPPEKTILILIATDTAGLLPTVLSRCQRIRFHPINRYILENTLVDQTGVTAETAAVISAAAGGSLKKALLLIKTNWISRRNWALKATGFDRPKTLFARSLRLRLAISAALAKNRDQAFEFLEILIFWLRDLIVFQYDASLIINRDMLDKINEASQRLTRQSILTKIELVRTAEQNLGQNANPRLTLDMLLLKIAID